MREILTTGRLDGLHFEPVVDDRGGLAFLEMTCVALPGVRLVMEASAVCELRDALSVVIGRFKVVA
jgi:hypothetical protein